MPIDAPATPSSASEGALLAGLPFAAALGVHLISSGGGRAVMRAPYDPKLVGDARTSVLHGGVITCLLDSCAGVAVMSAESRPLKVATLDLRLDYMRPAAPGADVIAEAETYRETELIAFVRAVAHDGDPSDPVATAVGAFMAEARRNEESNAGRRGAPGDPK